MKIVSILSALSATAFMLLCYTSAASSPKQLYHMRTTAKQLEAFLSRYDGDVDVWDIKEDKDEKNMVDVTIMTKISFMDKMERIESSSTFQVVRDHVDTEKLVLDEKKNVAKCTKATEGYMSKMSTSSSYTKSDFFKCFRKSGDIFSFVDEMVKQMPGHISKFDISKTVEGKVVPAYKIGRKSRFKKKALYIQGQIHAREWLSSPTVVYMMASLLDGINNKDPAVLKLVEMFDWYFVPLLNIDGYDYTWTNDRYWRKNRRGGYGVDLNRNYGPESKFCGPGASKYKWSQTYCGTKAFSEPEPAGVENWMNNSGVTLAGAIDVHTYGNMILRPFANSRNHLPSPHKEKMEKLGKDLETTINAVNSGTYRSMRGEELYVCAGTFMDAMFEMHSNIPSITFELRGSNFVVPEGHILLAGTEIWKGIQVFAQHAKNY